MSFEEAWVLPHPVESYSDGDLLGRVRGLLPDGLAIEITGEPDERTLSIEMPTNRVDSIAEKLARRDGQLDWDWRGEVETPPRGADAYVTHIDIVNDDRPLLRIYSNDGDNRQAWPLVFSVAASLAEQLGATPLDDAPPPSDSLPMFIEPGKTS